MLKITIHREHISRRCIYTFPAAHSDNWKVMARNRLRQYASFTDKGVPYWVQATDMHTGAPVDHFIARETV